MHLSEPYILVIVVGVPLLVFWWWCASPILRTLLRFNNIKERDVTMFHAMGAWRISNSP